LIVGILQSADQGDWTDVDRRVQTMKPTAPVQHGDRKAARDANLAGVRALRLKDYVVAIDAFSRGVRADASDVEVRNNLAFGYLESGDVSSALNTLVDVLQLATDRSIAWANMSEAFVQLKKPDMADASLKVAVRFNADRTQSVGYLNSVIETNPNEQFRESAARVLKDIDGIPLAAQ
jgi:tetratricopeptide (TPR) repeat protein